MKKTIYKFFICLQMFIIAFLILSNVRAGTSLPDNCIAIGLDGRYLCWRQPDIIPASSVSSAIDLSKWKLTIPGPKEINPIGDYSSKYFYRGDNNELIFWVDSSEKGSTSNSNYVRSELREMINLNDSKVNWSLQKGIHEFSADIQIPQTSSIPEQITVAQIHGIDANGGNQPPLLRVAIIKGSLYAWLKTDNSGDKTDKLLLLKDIGGEQFALKIFIKDKNLFITINNIERLSRNISFWKHNNYFKAGNYPQAINGISIVIFHSLVVKHL